MLTRAENEIMKFLSQGKSSKEIAKTLYISINTFKKHLNHIYEKYNLIDLDKECKRVKAVLIYQGNILNKILEKCNELTDTYPVALFQQEIKDIIKNETK